VRWGVPFFGVFLGVLFAEPLLLFLPFFFAMATVLCRRVGRWRAGAGAQKDCLKCACAANVQVPAAVNYDDYFPVAAALGYLIGTYGYVPVRSADARAQAVRCGSATATGRHRSEAHVSASQRNCKTGLWRSTNAPANTGSRGCCSCKQ
jgi:hypothetical protein